MRGLVFLVTLLVLVMCVPAMAGVGVQAGRVGVFVGPGAVDVTVGPIVPAPVPLVAPAEVVVPAYPYMYYWPGYTWWRPRAHWYGPPAVIIDHHDRHGDRPRKHDGPKGHGGGDKRK